MDMSVKLNLSYPAPAPAPASVADAQVAKTSAVQAAQAPEGPLKVSDRDALESAVSAIQEFVSATQRQLDFSIDDDTGQVVVKVIARQTGEVIRQIPSEAALKLAQNLSDAGSLLFAAKA